MQERFLSGEDREAIQCSRFIFLASGPYFMALDIAPSERSLPQTEIFDLREIITDELINQQANELKEARNLGLTRLNDPLNIVSRAISNHVFSHFQSLRPDLSQFPIPQMFDLEKLDPIENSAHWEELQTLIYQRGGNEALNQAQDKLNKLIELAKNQQALDMLQNKNGWSCIWQNPGLQPS